MVTQRVKYATFLLFMPMVTAELLTGSTPLFSLLNPLTLPFLLGLYGLGAILASEIATAWGKGWPTIMVLGAAYGVIEEALDVKSWFNPTWQGLGSLGTYGRVFGVNGVWAVELTTFHAIFSITIPIVLARLLFPGAANVRLFKNRTFGVIAALFLGAVAFGFVFFPYTPPPLQYAAAIGLAGLLVWCAHGLPARIPGARLPSHASAPRLVGLAFACTLAFFIIFWIVPLTPVPPLIDVLLLVPLGVGVCRLLVSRQFSDLQIFSLAAGAVVFLIAIAIIAFSLFDGPPFVGVAYALALVAMARRIKGGTALAQPTGP